MRAPGALVVAAIAAVAAVPAAHAATNPAQARLAAIVGAGKAQTSVHYESASDYGAIQIRFDGDAGVDRGIQRITFTKNGTTGHVTVILLARRAYVRGDAFTLMNFMGMSKSTAKSDAGKWLLLTPADSGYATVAAGITISDNMDELRPGGKLALVAPRTISGQRVTGVSGTMTVGGKKVVDTVYARSTGKALPVAEVATRGGQRVTATFSRWNERLSLSAPKHFVPIGGAPA